MISKYQLKRIENLKLGKIDDTGYKYYFNFENNVNEVTYTLSRDAFTCTCWHFANREVANEDKYGTCVHIMKVVKEIVEVEN